MTTFEYHQLLKFLYFEGYADSYEEAEYIIEEMSDEDFEELLESKHIPSEVALKLANATRMFPQTSKELRQWATIRGAEASKRRRRFTKADTHQGITKAPIKEDMDILDYLIYEGYADTNDNALVILENMSEEWRDSIIKEYKERPVKKMKAKAMQIVDNPNYTGKIEDVWRHQQILKHATKSAKSREAAKRKNQINVDKYWEKED